MARKGGLQLHLMGNDMRTFKGAACAAMVCAIMAVFAWDVEHDVIAQLAGEFLPDEIKRQFDFDDFARLIAYCHYPDMIECDGTGEPRRYRTLDETGAIVGEEDKEILRGQGFGNSGWFHRERGRAVCFALMAKAFRNGNHRNASFYLSVITHAVSDESALNHPPILQFVQYSRFKGVDYAIRKVEPGAKNVFGFRADGCVANRARQLLKDFRPTLPSRNFAEIMDALVAHCVEEGYYAGCKEGVISFGPLPEAQEALAQLVAMQVRAILTYAWAAWSLKGEWNLPDADFSARMSTRIRATNDAYDPAAQSVFDGVFDMSRNPRAPKATVGVVCEPYAMFSITRLSYVGRMLTASAARTLRDSGYAVRAIALRDLAKGLPSPKEMPFLFIDLGRDALMKGQAAAIKAYLEAGGRIIAVGGDDKSNVTGFAPHLVSHKDDEVPVSSKWALQNVEECKRMAVMFKGVRYPLKRNPNIDGFCKPYAMNSIAADVSVQPIAMLDNGRDTFTVAAKRGNVVWLSEYLLMPFVWSDDTSANWAEMRLDSFASKILLDAVER